MINKVRCTDGVWRTLDATELYHHKKSAGIIYQTALRNELSQRLGVEFEMVNEHGQAEIAGVPEQLLQLWSKRTAEIQADAEPKIAEYEATLGRALTASERVAVVKTAVLKTRPGKNHPALSELSALHNAWAAEASSAGFTPEGLMAGVRAAAGARPTLDVDADPALLAEAVRAAGRVRAVFSRADVAGQVASRVPATAGSAAATLARVEALTDQALDLTEAISVGEHPKGVTVRASDGRWASAEILAAEARILSLAERGRGGGYGAVPAEVATPDLILAGLDAGQRNASRQLTMSGDFLTVLTAPAGAGKTHCLGAATTVWQDAGYRVVGLAPSARAAAELAAATGGRADTLAKWLHNQGRLRTLPAPERAWSIPDHRTVLIVDEASMASTLDLDRLISLAARTAAKVVLVGDPGQIGVVNGPGGMLAALANAGRGVELNAIHRFEAGWERDASLALRSGDASVLDLYAGAGRVHSCGQGEDAVDAVHAYWAQARSWGWEALMMARTRTDVDALNARARTAAQASGEVHGPVVRLGERDWQAGDLLRTRRNDRTLPIADTHVRNGDRYRVLDTQGPGGGLIVEDQNGRGRTVLPAAYVAAHADYGWAITIDAAQGATTGVGIVLARPGLDRERLYVGMTRGRAANHVYVARDPVAQPDHEHGPRHEGPMADRPPEDHALDVLTAALAASGAQDAAHTAWEAARARTVEAQRQAVAQARNRRAAAPVIPAEHAATAALLARRRDELSQLRHDLERHRQQLHSAEADLAGNPRWSRSRRRELEARVEERRGALDGTVSAQWRLGVEVEDLTRQVDQQTREREVDERARVRSSRLSNADPTVAVLSPARPVSRTLHSPTAGRAGAELTRREAEHRRLLSYRRRGPASPNPTRRDDGPSIGW